MKILILFDSHYGNTLQLAAKVAEGVKDVEGAEPITRRVATSAPESILPADDEHSRHVRHQFAAIAEATLEDLIEADGIVVGSPTRFGNMTAAMKAFWDKTGPLWSRGQLFGKPGAVFTSTSTPHGGNEMTLLTMMVPMMHHGMIIVPPGYGHPVYQKAASPYGATSVSGPEADLDPTDDDGTAAFFLGQHLAQVATLLKSGHALLETH